MNKPGTFWGLSEILAAVENNVCFEARVAKLQHYNKNAEGRLERLFALTCHPDSKFDRVLEAAGDDLKSIRYMECKEHGVLDVTWENSIDILSNIESSTITNVRVGMENLMFLLEDLQPDDAKIILKLIQGKPISQCVNYYVLRSAFPNSLPEMVLGKSD